jgi:hypothetical protein
MKAGRVVINGRYRILGAAPTRNFFWRLTINGYEPCHRVLRHTLLRTRLARLRVEDEAPRARILSFGRRWRLRAQRWWSRHLLRSDAAVGCIARLATAQLDEFRNCGKLSPDGSGRGRLWRETRLRLRWTVS